MQQYAPKKNALTHIYIYINIKQKKKKTAHPPLRKTPKTLYFSFLLFFSFSISSTIRTIENQSHNNKKKHTLEKKKCVWETITSKKKKNKQKENKKNVNLLTTLSFQYIFIYFLGENLSLSLFSRHFDLPSAHE